MSYLGIAAAFFMGVCAYLGGYDVRFLLLIIPGIIVHGIGDGLDGKVAKLRGELRPKYGYYMDRVFDCISFSFVFIGIHLSRATHTDSWLYLLIIILLMAAHTFLKASVTSIFDMQIGKFGGAEHKLIEIGIIIATVTAGNPQIGHMSWTLLDAIGTIFAILLAVVFIGTVFRSLYGFNKIRE
jgi:phosphatidylserine synthase